MKTSLNILFTCVGRRVGLVQAFQKTMKEMGVEGKIFATDVTEAAAGLHVVDDYFIVPKARRIEYIPSLLKIVRENDIGLVVPLTDLDLRSLSRRQDEFKKIKCTVMVGQEKIVKLCRNKKLFSKRVESIGLSPIRTLSFDEFRDNPFFPCFVKPLGGSGGIGAALINNSRELQAHAKVFGKQLLMQDYVPGQEYTVDVYRTRAGEIISIVPRQRLIIRSGEVDIGITVNDEEIIESTRQLAESMEGLWGVFCCQCRRPAGGTPHFFEINPRFGGGAPLSIAAEADLPKYLLEEVLGLPISGQLGQFTPNLLLARYSKDICFLVDDPSTLPGFKSPIVK